MATTDYESLSLEELTHIQQEISEIVARRIAGEMQQYRTRVQQLAESMGFELKDTKAKPAAKKATSEMPTGPYQHPENESQVWDGTGRKPKWLRELLKSGWKLEDLRVGQTPVERPSEEAGFGEVKSEPATVAEETEVPVEESEERKTSSEWPL
jgi:DNA-binding protein H-NS